MRKCATMRAAKERLRLKQAEPIRESLPVIGLRVTIETPFRPREVYELRLNDYHDKRFHAFCNGARLSGLWSNSKLFRALEKMRYI